MKKISSILFLSLSLISLYPKGVKPQEIFKNNISTKNINANKKQNLNLSTNSTNEKNVQVLLTGIGQEAVLNKEISNNINKSNSKEIKEPRSEKDINNGNTQSNSASKIGIKNEIDTPIKTISKPKKEPV